MSHHDQLSFSIPRSWRDLPSPKVKRPSSINQPFAWTYSYTAFSLAFARAALRELGAGPTKNVLDPFAGSGTTIVAAAGFESRATGVDINPFSALLARARLAARPDIRKVQRHLDGHQHVSVDQEGDEVIAASDMAFVRATFESCRASTSPENFWRALLDDPEGEYDAEAITILSLCLAARECARLERGSNPIWYRTSKGSRSEARRAMRPLAQAWAEVIVRDLAGINDRGPRPVIQNADIRAISSSERFDLCLTSPPYLNRLDYVVAHLPELSVLQAFSPFSMQVLRRSMVGTTSITLKDYSDTPAEWGPTCRDLLLKVENHYSYASKRYYYHTFRQYFCSIYNALSKTNLLLDNKATGVIVVQNSYYKEVEVDAPEIVREMLQAVGCDARIIRTERVKSHMGLMSPAQAAYAPQKKLGESIIHFKKLG